MRFLRRFASLGISLAVALIIVLVLRTFVFQLYEVEQQSMENTISPGSVLVVDKLSLAFDGPEHGDILVLLTDGVLESKNARGEAFGLSRLTEVMEAAGANGTAPLHPILDAVEAFSGGRRHDDLTLVELRWC